MNAFWNALSMQGTTNKLSELLKSPNVKLEEVLDEDCVVNDLRDQKPAVVN